jgi:hypothetical protein
LREIAQHSNPPRGTWNREDRKMKYENHTVLLENGTVGTISRSSIDCQDIHTWIGEIVTLEFYDENGDIQRQEGKMVEVLEVAYRDQK